MKGYITRNEAAEILGVHPQSVANYAESGVIRKAKLRTDRKMDYFSKEDVESLSSSFIVEPEMKADIEELRKEYRSEVKNLKLKIKSIRALTDATTLDNLIYFGQASRGVIELAFNICGHTLTDRDKYIIEQALSLQGVRGSADELGLTAERTRQVLHRAIRKMGAVPKAFELKVERVQKENESLKEINRHLACVNNALKEAGVKTLTETEMRSVEERERYNSEYVVKHWDILNTKITDLNLSVRAYNCLRAADIETVAELVYLSRSDLMRCRNFGRKSLREIDTLVERHNLQFNAPVGELVTAKEKCTNWNGTYYRRINQKSL